MNNIYLVLAIAVLALPACETVPPEEGSKKIIIVRDRNYCRDYDSAMCGGSQ